MAMKVGRAQAGQFADHLIDTIPQEQPGISIGPNGNARFGAEHLSFRSLLF